MHGLHFLNNQLSGSLILKRLPGIRYINARGNNFNAVAVVYSEVYAHVNLQGSGVTSVVDENGKESKRFFA